MLASVGVFVTSGFVTEWLRVWLWAALVALWVMGGIALVARNRTDTVSSVTASMVERIGLFVIIVLGEVVVGVVTGIADAADRSAVTIGTGVLGLSIGMGMWWNYFDLLGRRLPAEGGPRLAAWMYSHLPLTMAIAAGGAAMVSLVEHAADARSPANTAWLLTGSVVVVLAGVMVSARALPDDGYPPGVKAHIAPTFGLAMVVILAIGAARPSPLVLVVAVSVILSLTWFWLFSVYLARGGTKELVAGEVSD